MRLVIYADLSRWLPIPASFPNAEGELPKEWENRVVAGMADAWRGRLDESSEEAVRFALQHALSRVDEDDSLTLQFWPTAAVANAIVHIVAVAAPVDDPGTWQPLDPDLPYVTQPVVEEVQTDNLGPGIEARYLVSTGESGVTLGGVNMAFSSDSGMIVIGVEPTLPQLIGVLLEPLRELVRGMRIVDDDGEQWTPAVVVPTTLGDRGEEWASLV